MHRNYSIDFSEDEFNVLSKALASYSNEMVRKKELAKSEKGSLDKSVLYKDEKEKADSLFLKLYRYASENRVAFSDTNLKLIRGIFSCECTKAIQDGDLLLASNFLEVINTVQSHLGGVRFKDVAGFSLTPSGNWDEIEEGEPTDEEFGMFGVLNAWAIGIESEIPDTLRDKVEEYLSNHMQTGITERGALIREREKTLNCLVVICSRFCSDEQMERLYKLATTIANNIK